MIQHLPEKFEIKKGAEEFPLMVVLSVTYVCNSRCIHCPYSNSDIREKYRDAQFMKPELFKKIADECGKYGAYIRLSGGGEPLLHKDIIELIEYAKKAGARIGLITNGSLMSGKAAERIVECGTDMIEFSADAGDKETYEKIRRGLNFDTLVENVKYTVKKRNELKSPSKIIASIVNQKIVHDKLDSIVAFWEKIVDKVQVRKYLTWNILNPQETGDPTPYLPPEKRIPCPWLFERLNIDTRGDVTICGEDIHFNYKFDNVLKKTIKEIWLGDKFTQWRKLHLERRGDEIEICKNCPDWQYRSWVYNYWKVEKDAEKRRRELIGDE
ncbi:MAG: radical SAM protein [Patescibacteria group bacterium]|nr:radical SAM protein [Patescibacteria group bacterium]